MDSTTITHTNGTTITTVSTAEPRPLASMISGTAIAKELREELKMEVQALQSEHSVTPGLAVVLVGDRPDSATYVRMKKKAAAEIGFHSVDVTMPDTATTVRSIPRAGRKL
jgi:5,10-methylene-tetrahydrofolate dehydrogenase/methenyl tetrahydrofolate cyclohydrolase